MDEPIHTGVTSVIRLVYFKGTDRETLPAIIDCGGRWTSNGAPLSRTWVKLAEAAKPDQDKLYPHRARHRLEGWRPDHPDRLQGIE